VLAEEVGVMQIPDPPDRPICAACNELLVHLYSARRGAWIAFVTLAGHRLKPHECDDRRPGLWRPDPFAARRNARGRALVDAALAGRPITEEGAP
jgi:hypothetical protein